MTTAISKELGKELSLPRPDVRGREDLSDLWQSCHGHLRPNERRLPLPPGSHEPCVLCGERRALRISADLRFGDHWRRDASLHYCEACQQFSLSAAEQEAHLEALGAKTDSAQLTAVDARLWSRGPLVLNIEPTTLCNFKCWYCIGRHMKQGEIAVEDFAQVLDNFPGLQVLALVGEGEPLLHKGFFDMVRMAKARGIRVVSLSNGSAFSESVVKKLCESGIDYISISIDSADPETFASSRIDGDLERVWRGIGRLRAYRDQHGYRTPIIGVKGTLFTHTRDEMPAILAEAKRHGVDVVESFQPLNPKRSYVDIYPEDKRALLSDVDEIMDAIRGGYASSVLPHIVEVAQRERIPFSNTGRPNPFRKNCDEEWIYSLLSGDVTPCCQIKDPMNPAWNLFRHRIDEILSDTDYENLRFNLWNGLFISQCEGCWKTH